MSNDCEKLIPSLCGNSMKVTMADCENVQLKATLTCGENEIYVPTVCEDK